jgi:hypothetical protein
MFEGVKGKTVAKITRKSLVSNNRTLTLICRTSEIWCIFPGPDGVGGVGERFGAFLESSPGATGHGLGAMVKPRGREEDAATPSLLRFTP